MNTASLLRVHSPDPQGDPSPLGRYLRVRGRTEALIAPLGPEDMVVQSMPDASPAKWHLAHTSWFFETFLLQPFVQGYRPIDPEYGYLFNSYYESVGPRQPRPKRGLLTRPPIAGVLAYRHHVDAHMSALLASDLPKGLVDSLELGLAHEEQHQELMLMDMLHLFSQSPGLPAYDHQWPTGVTGLQGKFQHHAGGLTEIGFNGSGFAFDNEMPRHQVWLQPFEIGDRLVTNGEWLSFMRDGGYDRAELWLSDGWTLARVESWEAPLYWIKRGGQWKEMTLGGLRDIDLGAHVSHISYFEAAAYAQWAGARLPSEAEWEVSADAGLIEQIDGCAWQWTRSAYSPYPGYRAASGALGEYNGKFMVGQMVLRGGASITTQRHSRPTYRNFYRPDQRWMASGLRLARDADPKEFQGESRSDFSADVVAGLSARQKQLSPKYFYDGTGSRLFEEICRTRDYYVTRSETALLSRIAGEIAVDIPEGAAFVEFGSGESAKTRILLDAAPRISTYVPIDISADAIERASASLRRAYASLEVAPVIADFTGTYHLPSAVKELPKIGFFPGSTIGNFDRQSAIAFLTRVRAVLGKGAALLVGADLVKEIPTLVAAYNDSEGVTARFNKNLLVRINRELKGDFDLDAFEHAAIWNAGSSRMEMHLLSRKTQIVKAAGQLFAFRNGEKIHTENSHKFTIEGFSRLAQEAGWRVVRTWVSDAPEVAVFRLENMPQPILACIK